MNNMNPSQNESRQEASFLFSDKFDDFLNDNVSMAGIPIHSSIDESVEETSLSTLWQQSLASNHTGSDAQRRDIIIICNKTFYHKIR
jgi:hypothetical protein